MLDKKETSEFQRLFADMLSFLIPAYSREGKSYLTIAIGCTGGRHRSVAIVEETADILRLSGVLVRSSHRDIEKG